MTVTFSKGSIDFDIPTLDIAAFTALNRDPVGLHDLGEQVGNGIPNTSSVLRHLRREAGRVPGDGRVRPYGFKYLAMWPSNLGEVVKACSDTGRPRTVPITDVGDGLSFANGWDSDGNWVDLVLQTRPN